MVGVVFAGSRERPITRAVAISEFQSFLGAEIDTTMPVDTGRC